MGDGIPVLSLAAALLLAAAPAPVPHCSTAGTLVARGARAELRLRHGTLFGCYRPDGINRTLWGAALDPNSAVPVAPRPARVAGYYAAVNVVAEGPVSGNTLMLLANLHNGRQHLGNIRQLGWQPGNSLGVERLVLRRTGTAAWTAWSPVFGFEVRMMQHTGQVTLIDSGTCIDPTSLRLSGRRATWTHCGKRRTRTLP